MRTYAPADPSTVLDAPPRRAVARPRRRPSRGHPAARGDVRRRCRRGWTTRIVAGLASRGIERLYTHQAEAIEAVHAGEDVVVVTPTASGKTLCYALPALQAIAEDPSARALFLFPTKALGQDQVTEFGELAASAGLSIITSTYDGDTPAPIRSAVRAAGQVVVTNPDMLHSAILPHHTKWFQLFEQLKLIVIDELHTYRGVFGGHVANVLRRLLRICAHYGSKPGHRVLLGDDREPGGARGDADRPTGTARRPQRRPGRRAARPARRPAGHGAGERRARLGGHAGPALGAAVPARRTPDDRLRSVAGRGRDPAHRACASRSARATGRGAASAATAAATCRRSAGRSSAGCATARSSASSRRTRSSSASTSAGSTCRSWPAIRARSPATWQQFGRAGRRQGTSVAILVASGAPVDQYVIHHPEFLLDNTPEEARLDPDNLHVLLAHLRAATFELPFEPGEVFGPAPADDLLAFLAEEGHVRQADDGRWYWSSENFPASEISLRTAAPENVVIIDTTPDRPRVLGEVDLFSAQVLVHERAIYIHESVQYYVDRLEWHERKAYVHKIDVGPLHLREPGGDAQAARGLRRGAGDRRHAQPRRGDGREPRDAVQEAQVHDRRERRLGADRPAGARAPDDRLLADRGPRPRATGGATSSTSRCSAPGGRSRRSRPCC